MAELLRKSLDHPDEVVEFPTARTQLVDLGDLTVAVRGVAVHEAARDHRAHTLKGLEGEWRLARLVARPESSA
ncbi:MAG: hypothetical protein ACRDNY_07750 [Gaiellaceae bacterium]